jgi:hypothetical protein
VAGWSRAGRRSKDQAAAKAGPSGSGFKDNIGELIEAANMHFVTASLAVDKANRG